MATPAATVREEVLTLTREQIIAIIEREAQKRLGLSARDLFRRYARGELDDPGRVSDLVILSHLLPEDDELFAAA
jgi:hypothetical protein